MGNRNPRPDYYRPNERVVREIIQKTDAYEQLVIEAQKIGKNLVDVGLKTNQIRNIFGVARQLQAKWENPNFIKDKSEDDQKKAQETQNRNARGLALLKPKLAYQQKREPAVTPLAEWLEMSIDMVFEGKKEPNETYQRFTRFMEFFEAILAYHTAQGGRAQ